MQLGSVIAARFVVDRRAGSGGMGTVYRAFDRVTGEPVALKVLGPGGPADAERSGREAAILAELDHPAIVRYVAHGALPGGEPWLAMEWLEGEDLAARLARGRLSLPECVAVAQRAAEALACAHARGMVHRDIKPSNLFLPDGDPARLKVLDFGVARAASDPRRLTGTGVLLGTLGYVAPEQIHGAADVDARADVFALGCVLFECLGGRPAFRGDHPMAVLAKILLEGPPSPATQRSGPPAPIDALVERMLAKDREHRPRDGAEVAAVLAGLAPLGDARPAPSTGRGLSSTPPPSLGLAEQRLVSMVLAGALEPDDTTLGQGATPGPELGRLVEPFGGRVALHAGRSVVVTLGSRGDAADRAERAARCALALHAHAPAAPLCVVTGRGHHAGGAVGGELIDRAVAVLRITPAGHVGLDEATAATLPARFVVERGEAGLRLRGARADAEVEPARRGRAAPFVGRERELGMVEAMLAGCASEPAAGVVLVTGPPGAGKSRLARELADRLRRREPHLEVLLGRGDSLGAGSPLGVIADAVRRAAGLREGDPLPRRLQKLRERAGRRLPAARAPRVAAFLGEIAGAPAPDDGDEALRAARRDPMLMADSTRAAWEDWLAAECGAGPVLLVLDDLHWVDPATVQLVDASLRNLRDLPLLCLALGRPELLTRFPDLWAARGPQLVRLGPLSRRASEALVREALGDGGDVEATVARIVEHGGGSPLYLQELARAVAEGRGGALPASMLDAVEARLDAEGIDGKRVLRAASIFGRAFSGDGVAALTGSTPAEAAACLAQLEARELIAPASAGAATARSGEYVFRDACVREAAYATLTEHDRALGHRLAGEWLARQGPADAVVMAEHFRRGGEPRRSVPWSRSAAAQALERSELGAAIARAEEGLSCGCSAPAEVGALRLIQAEAHVWRGELELAARRGEEAALLLPRGGAPWFRALTQVALAAGKQGDFDRVEALPALATPPLPGAEGARIVCLGFCESQLLFGGRLEAADRIGAELARPAVALDAQARGLVHQVHGLRASFSGDLGESRACLAAALAAFEEAGDRRNACAARANLGYVHAELGDLERAEEALSAARAAADHLALADLASVADHNLGPVLARRGRVDEGRRALGRAVEAFARQGDLRLLGVSQAYLSRIALGAGDLDAAERAAIAAVAAADRVPPLRPFALAVLSRVLLALGRVEEAAAAAGEAHAALTAGAKPEEGEALIALAHAEAQIARGDTVTVPAVLAAARERLLARAAQIRDLALRRRFLAEVADNAETLALAAAWTPG